MIVFPEQYSARVRDEDIGKAGVFALKLQNNNGTFEINPTVAERTADFIITVRDNAFIDYEMYKSLSFKVRVFNIKLWQEIIRLYLYRQFCIFILRLQLAYLGIPFIFVNTWRRLLLKRSVQRRIYRRQQRS